MRIKDIEVVAIGTLAVDYFAVVPKIPGVEEKIMAKSYEIHPGGVAGNILTQISRLGVSAGWIGKIGDDEAGKILIDEFDKEGIDYSNAEIVKDKFSMFTWIQVDDDGNRSITMFPNVIIELTGNDIIKNHADYIRNAKILQSELCLVPIDPIIKAMEIAKESGVMTVLNLDVPISYYVQDAELGTEEDVRQAISLADVLVPCKAAAAELIGSNNFDRDAHRLLELGPNIVAITLGENGCLILNREQKKRIPGFKVKVVDTTGAGDAFHGGLIYALLNGYGIEEIGKFANACGAFCCTKIGARSSGTLNDIISIIKS